MSAQNNNYSNNGVGKVRVTPFSHNKVWHRLLPLLLLVFIDSFSYFLIIPVLLQLFFDPHFNLLPHDTAYATRSLLTGITLSLSMFTSLIMAPFIGRLSDRIGRKKTLLFCLAAILAGFVLPIAGIDNQMLSLILLGRVLSGLGSVSQPIAQACVADLAKQKQKSFFLSWVALMMTLPIIVGPLAGGYLSDHHVIAWFGLTTPFYAASVLSLLNLVLLAFFFKETRVVNSTHAHMPGFFDTLLGLKKIARHYHVGMYLLVFFCLELAWSQYYQSISLYLAAVSHYSVQKISLFNAYMGLTMAAGLLFIYPWLLKLFSLINLMRCSVGLVLFGLMGCSVLHTAQAQWIFVIPVTLFTAAAYTSLLTLISDRVSAELQGWVLGYTSTLLFLAWTLTGVAAGWMASWHATLPLYVATLMMVIGAIGLCSQFLGGNINAELKD